MSLGRRCAVIAMLLISWAAQPQTPAKAPAAPAPEMRIDINHSSLEQLLTVPGMTRSWAGRILRFRPYRTKQDLLDNGILSSREYDRVKIFLIAHRDKQ